MTRPIRFASPQLLIWSTLLALACALSSAATGEDLGRLFFTQERRQQLDYQRQHNLEKRPEVVEDPRLAIDGVVVRSSGKRTVWVNGVARSEKDVSGESTIPSPTNPAHVVVRPSEALTADARVGDTINRNTGETAELLTGGRIRVGPPGR